MELRDLLTEVEKMKGDSDPMEASRMLLLLSIQDPSLSGYQDPMVLKQRYREIELRMHSAADQHSAVAEELDLLASTTPCEFTPDHVWTLIRAIKVQSGLLNMYLGPESKDSEISSRGDQIRRLQD